ncbi:uncharacterized protein PFL1_01050 [Pseudozyma flocculosa PF-1]|uniref:uncharacterized protein n=1 Tax=Pseudozyma flocculosa PF-1 TaxID=1277687 RepID=UPI0004560BD8|nr:uncharacterized protein PFL1_01050 [Pseudozyma flocculosa PF-1]EPQ31717.1 hypothetical protein PFL1_01050 [Pseudozyma flocculosa PF-1]
MALHPPVQQPLTVVRPTPLHPLDEIPLNLHPSATTIGSEPRPPRPSSHSSQHVGLHSACNLPTKGDHADAQEALAKLDRLTKQREKRNRWRRPADRITGALHRTSARHASGTGAADDSDSDSSDSIDLSKAFEEVKLKITSLPGHPVVGKVRNAASRARDRIGRGDTDSPGNSPDFEHGQDGLAYRFPLTRSIGAAARRFSLNKTPPPFAEQSSRAGLTAAPGAASPVAMHATKSPPPIPESPGSASSSTMPDTGRFKALASQNPELLVVDEEGHERQAEEQSHGGLRRPVTFFHDHGELSPGSRSAVTTPGSTPSTEPAANPIVFNLTPIGCSSASVIHDEPEEHDPGARLRGACTLSPSVSPSSASGLTESDEAEDDGSALQTDSSDEEDEDDDGGRGPNDELLTHGSVSLKHNEALSKEELKKHRKLLRREAKRQKRRAARGEVSADGPPTVAPTSKADHIKHGVGHRVSKGLHYASSQSRNRRAMERYSPNPVKQLYALNTDLHRSGTPPIDGMTAERRGSTGGPFSAISPTMSRSGQSITGGRRGSLANSRRSSFAETERDHDATTLSIGQAVGEDFEGGHVLGRWNTQMSMASSMGSFRRYMRAPNVLRKRRQGKWEAEMAAIEAAAGGTPTAQADPEKELDQMLGKLAAEQAPRDAGKERYEFDVLYENQRGLLVFGIPKFSPRTLFQWDPSPWTSADNKKSPYNIANAQLPDPSWDWIYPEWLIDMTGDTDEAGWQYSGNFGRRFWPNVHFPHGKLGLPRTGMDGITEMNARLAEKQAKREEKERQREDDGLEALKRSARAKSDKWQGTPDPWTFVRRRRWIRLRRRRPLATAETAAEASREAKEASPGQEKLTVPASDGAPTALTDNDSFLGTSSSLSGSDEEDEEEDDGEQSDGRDYAPAGAGPSTFLPRRLPGNLANGSDPFKFKKDVVRTRRAQRHAKEFTGTLKELKSLLPSLLDGEREDRATRPHPDGHHGGVSKAAMLKLNRIDARNPFISWKLVKSRLEDADMAFASATLRAREKRYRRRQNEELARSRRAKAAAGDGGSRSIPSQFLADKSMQSSGVGGGGIAEAGSAKTSRAANLQEHVDEATSLPASSGAFKELTREALIEINYSRALRVLKACKLDRQRLELWKLWLGVESLDTLMENARALDPRESIEAAMGSPSPPPSLSAHRLSSVSGGGGGVYFSGGSSSRHRQRADKARTRWRATVSGPDSSDVWDVLERKLDDVLLLFEFQSSRAALLRSLLAMHALSHPEHVYRDRSLRSNPIELSPTHVHGSPQEMGGAQPPPPSQQVRQGAWQRSGLPRLEFFSDVQALLDALPGPGAAETEARRTRMGELQDASVSSLDVLLNATTTDLADVLHLHPPAASSSSTTHSPSVTPAPPSSSLSNRAIPQRTTSVPPRPTQRHTGGSTE